METTIQARDIILEYVAVEEVKEGTFGRLVTLGIQHCERAYGNTAEASVNLDKELTEEEIAYITEHKPDCKRFKDGRYVRSHALPDTYLQARSVVVGALEDGLSLVDANGNPLGKTALEKARRAHKKALAAEEAGEGGDAEASGEADKSPEEKVLIVLDTLLKLLPQCADQQSMAEHCIAAMRPLSGV